MEQTLFRVKNLEKFIQKYGEDALIKEGKAAVRSRIVDGHYLTEARNETG